MSDFWDIIGPKDLLAPVLLTLRCVAPVVQYACTFREQDTVQKPHDEVIATVGAVCPHTPEDLIVGDAVETA